ncbi:MAG TPA: MBL fold metallo-hydrolase [Verrucomicrobiae bacterium]|nr:MBL fold metallo-hydrolase [Verrucomicrobiae bacterium]
MIVETFAVGPLGCNCTIAGDERTGEAIVVDGGDGVDEVVMRLRRHKLRATLLVHTHAHIDHIAELGRLRELTNGRGLLHPADLPLYRTLPMQAGWLGLSHAPPVVELDGELLDGDELAAGAVRLDVLHTPGHTPGSVCFAVTENGGPPLLLTGDTLFAGSIGRWDLGGTSMEDIVASIHRKLMDFPDATPVVPGHGPFTSIGTERVSNPYLTRSS